MSPIDSPTINDSNYITDTAETTGMEAEQLHESLAERDRLASRASLLDDQLTLARRELADFKERVVQIATDHAEQHGWCDVVGQALADLGLQRPPYRCTAELVIRVQFSATRTSARRLPDPGWVRDSILGIGEIREAIHEHFALDSDHADWTVEEIDLTVDDVQDAS